MEKALNFIRQYYPSLLIPPVIILLIVGALWTDRLTPLTYVLSVLLNLTFTFIIAAYFTREQYSKDYERLLREKARTAVRRPLEISRSIARMINNIERFREKQSLREEDLDKDLLENSWPVREIRRRKYWGTQ